MATEYRVTKVLEQSLKLREIQPVCKERESCERCTGKASRGWEY